MKALGAAAKARAEGQPASAWDALAADALSEEEKAALLADDSEGELASLFAPLGDEFVDQIVGEVLSEAQTETTAPPRTQAEPVSTDGAPADVPAPANSNRWWLIVAPIVAVAALLLLFFALPGTPPLPEYSFDVQGGDQMVRGGDEPDAQMVLTLAHGSKVTISGRPPEALDGEVTGTVLVRADGVLTATDAAVEVAEGGAVRWVGTAGQAPLLNGVTSAHLVLHRPGASAGTILAAAEGTGDLPVHEVAVRIAP